MARASTTPLPTYSTDDVIRTAVNQIADRVDDIDAEGTVYTSYGAAGSGQRMGIMVASTNSPAAMKALADYVCDGTADDVQWQAAIDAAEAAALVSTVQAVYLLPGDYFLSAKILWKATSLIGLGGAPTHGVRVFWTGAADGTVIEGQIPAGGIGGNGSKRMSGIDFRASATDPATWLDLTLDQVDDRCRLEDVHFGRCNGSAVKIGQWYNVHWNNLRFDGWGNGGAAIELGASAATAPNLASFVLDKFTVDWGGYPIGSPGGSIIKLNNGNGNNVGVVVLRNGRIEGSSAFGGFKAIFHLAPTGGTINSRWAGIHLQDVSYQNSDPAGPSGYVAVYRETANTTARDGFLFTNVRQTGLGAITGGTWPGSFVAPPLQTQYPFLAWGDTTVLGSVFDNLTALGSIRVRTKAGAFSDSDLQGAVSDGTIAGVDTTNHRLYIKSGGVWKYAALT